MILKNIQSVKYLGIFGLIWFVFQACQPDGKLNLVNNGKSEFVIVKNKDGGPEELKAAEELQKYFELISGVRLSIVAEATGENRKIIVTSNPDLDENQISIQVEGENLTLSGGDSEATLYAVYEFLEKFQNCRWYSPEAEVIPVSKTISVDADLNYEYRPEILIRTVHSKLFYSNPEYAAKQKVTTEAFPYYVPGAKVHTFHRFMPEEVFYKAHPEYFALRGNKRLPTQLCLTNPKVLEIVSDSVKAYFDRFPEARVISVSQDDNQQHCQCQNCSAIDNEEGSPSGSMIRFVNEVAGRFPDKTISTLAYQYTRKPCATRPADNVLITLCSIECDRSGPIEEKCEDFAEDLRGWKELSDHIRIWDYTTQFTNFLAPFPNLHTLKENIVFFKNNNAKWIFEQHSHQPSELFELRSYLLAKLLWNPDADYEVLLQDFCEGYYGSAGSSVKKYVDAIHTSIQDDPDFFLFLYGDPSQAFDSFLAPEKLALYKTYFDEAEAAVQDDMELLKRVKRARLGVDYAILEASRKNLNEELNLVLINAQGEKEINPKVEELLSSFTTTAGEAGIEMMNEVRYGVEEYEENYKKTMRVATQPNMALGKKVTLETSPKKYADEDPQVLTDGALGGNSFFANWLGFEGNDMIAIVDLGEAAKISAISTGFLQVTNHVVFFPLEVTYYSSVDGENFIKLDGVTNPDPLTKKSKVNDIKYFNIDFEELEVRYLKVVAKNMQEPPYWHHAAGTNAWIFADEIMID